MRGNEEKRENYVEEKEKKKKKKKKKKSWSPNSNKQILGGRHGGEKAK